MYGVPMGRQDGALLASFSGCRHSCLVTSAADPRIEWPCVDLLCSRVSVPRGEWLGASSGESALQQLPFEKSFPFFSFVHRGKKLPTQVLCRQST